MSYPGEGGLADIKARIYRERGNVTMDANGDATITFAQPVSTALTSHVQLTAWVPSGNPIVVNPVAWIEANGERTGVTIKAARLRALPNPLPLLSQLVGFRVWQETEVDGVNVDWMLY